MSRIKTSALVLAFSVLFAGGPVQAAQAPAVPVWASLQALWARGWALLGPGQATPHEAAGKSKKGASTDPNGGSLTAIPSLERVFSVDSSGSNR